MRRRNLDFALLFDRSRRLGNEFRLLRSDFRSDRRLNFDGLRLGCDFSRRLGCDFGYGLGELRDVSSDIPVARIGLERARVPVFCFVRFTFLASYIPQLAEDYRVVRIQGKSFLKNSAGLLVRCASYRAWPYTT